MSKPTVLVIDDEKNIREALRQYLTMEGFDVQAAEDGVDGLNKFQTLLPDAVILDLKMPKMSGMDFLNKAFAVKQDSPIIVLTGHGGIDEAVECMKRGAYDFFMKPPEMEKLILVLRRAIDEVSRHERQDELEKMVDERFRFDSIIGNSPGIKRVLDTVRQIAPTDATILITGESGTGKELVASAIHNNSRRSKGPFIKVHCAALTDTLLESELFGHEKGSFTGAAARKRGRFELADGGTIFLDEIGEISQTTQVKLLRVLQEHEFERVGGEETLKVDIRVITATNKDLHHEVEQGRFREDLFYRLNVINLHIPPLRERKEDIPLLINHFVNFYSGRHGKQAVQISLKALKLMENYIWKGNIRELQNLVENLIVMSKGVEITPDDLPAAIRNFSGQEELRLEVGIPLDEVERRAIIATLDSVNGNKSHAARVLGIGRKTLLRKLEGYGMTLSGEDGGDE
ncbi:MAG: sigma-54-dependent Fis family transcriptional regulator [Brevinematales bacterium]|nr:sigma-54-dependent Fis family transcriptional regulator [Brevinematales bacterium]